MVVFLLISSDVNQWLDTTQPTPPKKLNLQWNWNFYRDLFSWMVDLIPLNWIQSVFKCLFELFSSQESVQVLLYWSQHMSDHLIFILIRAQGKEIVCLVYTISSQITILSNCVVFSFSNTNQATRHTMSVLNPF